MFDTPILFIIFNRPDTTKEVFNKIAQVKPKKLYIAADGPRENNKNDIELCKQAREVVANINWECQVYKKFNDENLGCGINVSSAITWAFENEDRLIILEDDTLPALSFFYFCEELLERYKDDSRIMHIAGTNWHPEILPRNNESYFFSIHAHIWGWATWCSAWKKFDYSTNDFSVFIKNHNYEDVYFNKKEQKWFLERFLSFYNNNYSNLEKSNWDYQWYYTVIKNNGLCITPSSNLVMNIGVKGTHTIGENINLYYYRSIDKKFIIKEHPEFIVPFRKFDEFHFKKMNYIKIRTRILKKIKKLFSFIR